MKRNLLLFLLVFTVILCISSCNLIPGLSGNGGTGDGSGENGGNNNGGNENGGNENGGNDGGEDVAPTAESIVLSGYKTTIDFGTELNFEELVVLAKMSDGSEKILSSDEYTATCEGFNSMKVGTYKVEISLNDSDISTSYDVSVAPADRLKVLMIGNSYADDTINYAYEIAKAAGISPKNILIADVYIGGCTLDTHWNNVQNDAHVYRFGLEREGYFDGSSYQNWSIDDAITYADWDFITLQQGSASSGIESSYSNLQKLMDYVLDVAVSPDNPNANPNVKLVWHQTWAYTQGSANSGFGNYGNDQMTMYNAIQDCLRSQILNKDFAAIIPNGTAIQNARTSFIGDNLTRDQYDHLSEDAGRYIASLGLVGTLTGRDLSGITWKPADSGFVFNVTDEMLAVCKESAKNALNSPFEITLSEHAPKGMFDCFEGRGTKEHPYLIQSAEDMWKLSELTAGHNIGDANLYFKLTADIDLGAESWRPICSSAELGWVETAKSFNGNFDGDGHTVTFVGNYTGDAWAKGLFSAVGGHVHDLILRGDITMEKGRVGSLAAMAMEGARIENVTSYMNISIQNNQAGGIIGYIAAPNVTLTNCKNYGKIVGRELVGGIVGGSWQNVSYIDCENHGDVTATSTTAGGICGEKYASASLTNCKNFGSVKAGGTVASADVGSAGSYAGYLIGKQY